MTKQLGFLVLGLLAFSAAWAEEEMISPAQRKRLEVIEKLDAVGFSYQSVHVDKAGSCILDLTESTVADLTPLQGLPIDFISLRWSKKFSDLSPLEGMQLSGLDLRDTAVTDLSPLASMPLKTLVIAGTGVKDISALKQMPLTFLDASGTQIHDLAPLQETALKTLILNRTQITELSPLKDLPLYSLHISETPVKDLRPLGGTNLGELFFTSERITDGIGVIRNMKSILFLGGGKQSDHFIDPAEFWERYEHGHPVDNLLAELRAGENQYAPEPEQVQMEPGRERRARELVQQLADDRFLVRQEAEGLLSAESRSIIPWLETFAESHDLEVRYRVRRIVKNLTTDIDNAPYFAFVFHKPIKMKPTQWQAALAPWQSKAETVSNKDPMKRLGYGVGTFAQSFVPKTNKITGVQLMIQAASKGSGWIKVDLCQDEGGRPSDIVLARTWVRLEEVGLPPHDVYLPIDLPDTRVKADKVYWLTYTEITDPKSATKLSTYHGWTAGNAYPSGRMLLPAGHVTVERDVCFQVLTTCPPVPLLRKATPKQIESLPKVSSIELKWN